MTAAESKILKISDAADRATALGAYLDRRIPSPAFLEALLADDYDVVRAEALDCAITGFVPLSRQRLADMTQVEESPVVRGRLKLYLCVSGYDSELLILRNRQFADENLRDEPWERGCEYWQGKSSRSFLALAVMLFEDDYGVTETALDLLLLLATGIHRRLLETIITVCLTAEGIKVSRVRLSEALRELAEPPAQPLTANEIRSQLQ